MLQFGAVFPIAATDSAMETSEVKGERAYV